MIGFLIKLFPHFLLKINAVWQICWPKFTTTYYRERYIQSSLTCSCLFGFFSHISHPFPTLTGFKLFFDRKIKITIDRLMVGRVPIVINLLRWRISWGWWRVTKILWIHFRKQVASLEVNRIICDIWAAIKTKTTLMPVTALQCFLFFTKLIN